MPQYNIKYVNQPKQPSGKYGSLKTVEGQTLFCPVALLSQFSPGMVCEILTQPQRWGNNDVTVIQSGPIGAQTAPPQAGVSRGTATMRDTPSVEARMIFVTGVVGRAMGSGKFAASEITVLAQEAARAYDLVNRPNLRAVPPDASNYDFGEPPPSEPGDPGPSFND